MTFQKSKRPAPRSENPRWRLAGLATNRTAAIANASRAARTPTPTRRPLDRPGRVIMVAKIATPAPMMPDLLPAPAAPAMMKRSRSAYNIRSR